MSNALTAPHFQSHEAGPRMAGKDSAGRMARSARTAARSTTPIRPRSPGWYRCAEKECRKDFTVTTGTVMERSHIAAQQVADGLLPACPPARRACQRPPAPPRAWRRLQVRVVHVPSHPRGHARWWPWPARRRGQDRRGRRNLFRQRREAAASHQAAQGSPLHQGGRKRPGDKRADRRAGRARRPRPLVPCRRRRQGDRRQDRDAKTSPARAALHTDESHLYVEVGERISPPTRPSSTRARRIRPRRRVTPIRSKATSRSSSAACTASISTATRSTLHRYLAGVRFPLQSPRRARLSGRDVRRISPRGRLWPIPRCTALCRQRRQIFLPSLQRSNILCCRAFEIHSKPNRPDDDTNDAGGHYSRSSL